MSTVRNEKAMASNLAATAADEPDDEKDDGDSKSPGPYKSPLSKSGKTAGFFTIHKYGQGKWTRLGTIAVAGVLGAMTAYNVNDWLNAAWPNNTDANHIRTVKQIVLGISILFLTVFCGLVYWIGNKPSNVDFLISTDSEMKKVNWTTKGELLGSTRVVILFLFFIAIFLFVIDLVFSQFFQLIGILLKAS